MLLKENLRMALKSILSNKMRSFLTMLGIIIGISSVITIVASGKGAEKYMLDQFASTGSTTVLLNLNSKKASDSDKITIEDTKAIKNRVANVKCASPIIQNFCSASIGKEAKDAIVAAGTDDMEFLGNVKVLSGRFFSEDDYLTGRKVAVIDEQMAKLLFGTTDVVGMSFDVFIEKTRLNLKISGVSKAESGDFSFPNMPGSVYLPITTYSEATSIANAYTQIYIMSTDSEFTESVGNGSINLLEARHSNRGRDIYRAENMMKQVDMITGILGLVQNFVAAVAGISLIVGGIGVMNIMLVAVTERTREIGIRKALGAKTSAILYQFLTESAILTLIGGTIGLILGVLGAYGFCSLAKITPVFSLGTIIGTIIFSGSVGIFFGIYPARKAAKLSPIEALRHQ